MLATSAYFMRYMLCRTTRHAVRPAEQRAAACVTCSKRFRQCAWPPAACICVSCYLMLPRPSSRHMLQLWLASSQVIMNSHLLSLHRACSMQSDLLQHVCAVLPLNPGTRLGNLANMHVVDPYSKHACSSCHKHLRCCNCTVCLVSSASENCLCRGKAS